MVTKVNTMDKVINKDYLLNNLKNYDEQIVEPALEQTAISVLEACQELIDEKQAGDVIDDAKETELKAYSNKKVNELLLNKVDKEDGKTLTTNDLTDELKEDYDLAVTNSHTHSNKETLDNTTASFTTELETAIGNAYVKPEDGIPKTDLSEDVAASLDLADSALQEETQLTLGTTTGSGNAVTSISVDNHKITLSKETTFLTASDIEGKADSATTLAGYGITDAKIEDGTVTLGSNTITPVTDVSDKLNVSGNNGTADGVSALLNQLTTGTSVPKDEDWYISQYVEGGTTTTTFHRRPIKYLFSYIKGKLTNKIISYKVGSEEASTITDMSATATYDSKKIPLLNDTVSEDNGGFRWLSFSVFWTYIKGKISSILGLNGKQLILQGSTVGSNDYNSANPRLEFKNADGSQNLSLEYTDFDTVQGPSSLTLTGNQGNEYFIAPHIRANGKIQNNHNCIKNYNEINLMSYATTNYFPIVWAPSDEMLDIELQSRNLSGSEPYNQNTLHIFVRTNGWSDTPCSYQILEFGRYENNETTIMGISRGSENGTFGIWVRGGNIYRIKANRDFTTVTSSYAVGNETWAGNTTSWGSGSSVTLWKNFSDFSGLSSSNVASCINTELYGKNIKVEGHIKVPDIDSESSNGTLPAIYASDGNVTIGGEFGENPGYTTITNDCKMLNSLNVSSSITAGSINVSTGGASFTKTLIIPTAAPSSPSNGMIWIS